MTNHIGPSNEIKVGIFSCILQTSEFYILEPHWEKGCERINAIYVCNLEKMEFVAKNTMIYET